VADAGCDTAGKWASSRATRSREVGCGSGYFALPAARITDPAPVYALDLDESLLDELAHVAEQQRVENVVPLHGDARSPDGPPPRARRRPGRSEHVPRRRGVRRTRGAGVRRRPSGRPVRRRQLARAGREETTIAGDPRGPPTALRMTPDETAADVQDAADFSLEERIDLPPYHYALVFER